MSSPAVMQKEEQTSIEFSTFFTWAALVKAFRPTAYMGLKKATKSFYNQFSSTSCVVITRNHPNMGS